MIVSKRGNDANTGTKRFPFRTLKRAAGALAILFMLGGTVFAQATTHQATLTWTDTLNPAGTTYTISRATGLCSGTPVFSTIASGVAVKTYVDTTVTPGNYCYEVEASAGGVLSAPSNTALAPIPSFPPTGLTVVVQ